MIWAGPRYLLLLLIVITLPPKSVLMKTSLNKRGESSSDSPKIRSPERLFSDAYYDPFDHSSTGTHKGTNAREASPPKGGPHQSVPVSFAQEHRQNLGQASEDKRGRPKKSQQVRAENTVSRKASRDKYNEKRRKKSAEKKLEKAINDQKRFNELREKALISNSTGMLTRQDRYFLSKMRNPEKVKELNRQKNIRRKEREARAKELANTPIEGQNLRKRGNSSNQSPEHYGIVKDHGQDATSKGLQADVRSPKSPSHQPLKVNLGVGMHMDQPSSSTFSSRKRGRPKGSVKFSTEEERIAAKKASSKEFNKKRRQVSAHKKLSKEAKDKIRLKELQDKANQGGLSILTTKERYFVQRMKDPQKMKERNRKSNLRRKERKSQLIKVPWVTSTDEQHFLSKRGENSSLSPQSSSPVNKYGPIRSPTHLYTDAYYDPFDSQMTKEHNHELILTTAPLRRKRGRPKGTTKYKTVDEHDHEPTLATAPLRRKRGRPIGTTKYKTVEERNAARWASRLKAKEKRQKVSAQKKIAKQVNDQNRLREMQEKYSLNQSTPISQSDRSFLYRVNNPEKIKEVNRRKNLKKKEKYARKKASSILDTSANEGHTLSKRGENSSQSSKRTLSVNQSIEGAHVHKDPQKRLFHQSLDLNQAIALPEDGSSSSMNVVRPKRGRPMGSKKYLSEEERIASKKATDKKSKEKRRQLMAGKKVIKKVNNQIRFARLKLLNQKSSLTRGERAFMQRMQNPEKMKGRDRVSYEQRKAKKSQKLKIPWATSTDEQHFLSKRSERSSLSPNSSPINEYGPVRSPTHLYTDAFYDPFDSQMTQTHDHQSTSSRTSSSKVGRPKGSVKYSTEEERVAARRASDLKRIERKRQLRVQKRLIKDANDQVRLKELQEKKLTSKKGTLTRNEKIFLRKMKDPEKAKAANRKKNQKRKHKLASEKAAGISDAHSNHQQL